MVVFETDRQVLRRLTVEDAPFMLRLLNEPSFLQHIGDRGVRSLADAQQSCEARLLLRSHGADARQARRGEAVCPQARQRERVNW